MPRLPRHAPAPGPNNPLIPSTSAMTTGASVRPVFTGLGLDPQNSNAERLKG